MRPDVRTTPDRGPSRVSGTRRTPRVSRPRRTTPLVLLLAVALAAAVGAAPASAQDAPRGIPRFAVEAGPFALEGPVRPGEYLADVGRRAAVLGSETGEFEVWSWPVKLVDGLGLAFRIPDYDSPVPGARVARTVVARPEGATVVYSHATFTVREHVFVPTDEPGALILLEVETVRPLDVHVRMHADFELAWPGGFGGEYITWAGDRRAFLLSQGGVHRYNALVGSPFATDGTSHPAHDAPTVPSRFVLRFEAGTATTDFIPIVVAGGAMPLDSAQTVYDRLLEDAPRLWREKVDHYRAVREDRLSLASPDPDLDVALEWAKVNLDQQLACNPELGCGLVAGFGRAGAGNYRPGFAWYFGGDAAINSLAMDGVGQYELVARGLRFLGRHQRDDGKIPHEISHAAATLPWFTDYPYTWFHGDTTPYWILACWEYWKASGDGAFLEEMWPKIRLAYEWSKATDTDGDGLMEHDEAGAGAIEVGGLGVDLHTDIYLAGVWVGALDGMRDMARAMGDAALSAEAEALHAKAGESVEASYWIEDAGIYAFALLKPESTAADGADAGDGSVTLASDAADGSRRGLRVNDALTVWPATAMAFGLLDPDRSDRMLEAVGSSVLTADWGAHLLSREHRLYDPLHYNNGAVWPFMTGFVALAHYRHHRAWAGYDLVRDIGRMTYDFALGRHPELLSGAFYRTLDTTVPHQFFATSMFVTPLVRGMLGLESDAAHGRATIAPHLPADWDRAAVSNFRVGDVRLAVDVERTNGRYMLHVRRETDGARDEPVTVRVSPALPLGAEIVRVTVNDRDATFEIRQTPHDVHAAVEFPLRADARLKVTYRGGVEVAAPDESVRYGQPTQGLRILDFRRDGGSYHLEVEGLPGRVYEVRLRSDVAIAAEGADVVGRTGDLTTLAVRFDGPGGDYVRRTVRLRTR